MKIRTSSLTGDALTLILMASGMVQGAAPVENAQILRQVNPIYPQTAKKARIEGTVRFNAIIDQDGFVKNIQPVSGHPMLVSAAIAAVKQWAYRPTMLEGKAVALPTQIQVNFALK
ncbi:MAG: energy transducer TonB [Acidobacteria bacterium]|nr:energy transducer TonB [Acidobacteriota bacterium]